MMAQPDPSDKRTGYDDRLRRLAEIELQVRLHRERSAALIAEAKRIVAAVRDARGTRPDRSAAAFGALLAAKEMAERASEAKSELLARVAHDLKQPLQVILGMAEVLGPYVPAERRRVLDRIGAAAIRMNRALDVLLTAAWTESAALQPTIVPVPLDELFAEIERELRPAAESKALRFRARPCRGGVRVLSDAEQLASIVQNLVENAIKYTDRGGILLGCRRRGAGGSIEIRVHDTGCGIAEADIGSIFEAFHRLEPGAGRGVGLGLAIVRRLADALGHELTVRSAPGRGSCFGIVVPIAEAHEHGTPAEATPERPTALARWKSG
jgi:signal transduction histidine kinase